MSEGVSAEAIEKGWHKPSCPFCQRIAAGDVDHVYPKEGPLNTVRFPPLNPVVPGHMLFVPYAHVEHGPRWGLEVGVAMAWAESYAGGLMSDFNLITSSGPSATQTIDHVHIHYVPRRPGDGLHLPWTGQHS